MNDRIPRGARAALPRFTSLLAGHRLSSVLIAACELGVFEALRDGPLDSGQLAVATDCAPTALLRLLRVLQSLGLVTLRAERVALTGSGRLWLRGESALPDRALLAAREYVPLWSTLAHCVRRDRSGDQQVLGCSTWEHRARDPQANAAFNRLMTQGQSTTARALAEAIRFPADATIVDIGGGSGALLIALLPLLPEARGIVLEQAHVAPSARAAVRDAGLGGRCRVRSGSFLERVPAGAGVYVLQHVLHDFDDERVLQVLHNVRRALRPAAVLLVIENLLPASGRASLETLLLDLHMLVTHGGRERTRAQYRALFEAAGLVESGCTALLGERHVLTAKVPV